MVHSLRDIFEHKVQINFFLFLPIRVEEPFHVHDVFVLEHPHDLETQARPLSMNCASDVVRFRSELT